MDIGLKARIVGAALLLLALMGTGLYIDHLHRKVKTLSDLNVDLQVKLNVQGLEVLKLKTDSDRRLQEAQAKLLAAEKAAAEQKQEAQVIYKTAPVDPKDTCKSALSLMNGVKK